ncbi:hypothetical protein [Carnobacterium maltaromaticum]|nr:hypothetical protein [Carnobacterium maltaromaticum]MCI1817597.1 hypothetical protein [Carnobacterium maltaromaticum]CAD5898768.1 conserved exported hypothetical protein [Carnobacterium maltaromaticum]
MIKWYKLMAIGCLFWLVSCFSYPTSVFADTKPDESEMKLLLVYDSLDTSGSGEEKISTLQRLLTSFNVVVTTISVAEYHENEMSDFNGIITLINAPDLAIENPFYLKDRDAFTGLKLHIGGNLPMKWQKQLGIELEQINGERGNLVSLSEKANEVMETELTVEVAAGISEAAEEFGRIDFENHNELKPYGILNGNSAYLPYLKPDGLSFILTSQLIQKWLKQTGTFNPMLVFTDVTPFSNLPLIKYLADQLYDAGIPFALSATSVWQNVDLKAMKNYTDMLRYVAARNGGLLLKTPEVMGVSREQRDLAAIMPKTIDELVADNVFPVGISAPAYWNQDTEYQQDGLSYSSTVLLLPNPKKLQYRDKTTTAPIYDTTYFGLPVSSLKAVEWGAIERHKFNTPTALTYKIPDTRKEWDNINKELNQLPFLFRGINLREHNVVTETNQIKVENAILTVNGEREYPETMVKSVAGKQAKTVKDTGSLTDFFNLQDKIFIVIISATLFVLSIFFVIGYNLYKGKYRK